MVYNLSRIYFHDNYEDNAVTLLIIKFLLYPVKCFSNFYHYIYFLNFFTGLLYKPVDRITQYSLILNVRFFFIYCLIYKIVRNCDYDKIPQWK